MTRKKFVKMLMHRQIPRNIANALAVIVQQRGLSYFNTLGDFLLLSWIRAYNTWEGDVLVWQTSATNVCVEVLANE